MKPALSPYKRRRPSILLNIWLYRRMILVAMLLGLLLWFIVINDTPVVVAFPFGLGEIHTQSGVAILLGFVAGSVVTMVAFAGWQALHRSRSRSAGDPASAPRGRVDFNDDRPPPDYAAKTPEGFPDADWAGR